MRVKIIVELLPTPKAPPLNPPKKAPAQSRNIYLGSSIFILYSYPIYLKYYNRFIVYLHKKISNTTTSKLKMGTAMWYGSEQIVKYIIFPWARNDNVSKTRNIPIVAKIWCKWIPDSYNYNLANCYLLLIICSDMFGWVPSLLIIDIGLLYVNPFLF